jgi:nucleoside-diphosphate-sugar epimerase
MSEEEAPDGVYHVGSERSISIRDLAELVAKRYSLLTRRECGVSILNQTSPLDGTSYYVPETHRTREVLGLSETISLELSIDSMIAAELEHLDSAK